MSAGYAKADIEGVGLGLRRRHYDELMRGVGGVPWLEVLVDNYAHAAGPARSFLEGLRARYPVTFHGVGLSLGSTDPLDREYLGRIAALARDFEPAWISEHLAWTSVGGRHHHELLPLPFNEESVRTLAGHIREAQDILGSRILVENSAGYLSFESSEVDEAEFVLAVLDEADCLLLLDVNNVYVNSRNHGYDPSVFLAMMPADRVCQMHLAGYDDRDGTLIDAHAGPVDAPVWSLYEQAVRLFPNVPTCIEWDNDVPPLEVMLAEVARATRIGGARVTTRCEEGRGAA